MSAIRKARESAELAIAFFQKNEAMLDKCVTALADRFERGGMLWTMGNGGSACDAEHVEVEFAHPILERRRALPAQSLVSPAIVTAIGNDGDFSRVFVETIELRGKPEDALLGISTSGQSANVTRALRKGRSLGLLTIGFTGRDGGAMADACDFAFIVPSWSVHRIQEVHTILLHLLWDELHVEMGADDVL